MRQMEGKKDKYAISFTSTTAKMPLAEKWLYGLHSGFAFQVTWVIFSYYLMYFYTDIFGISAALAGVVMMGARLFDVFTDAMIGFMIDNCHFKFGKYRSWEIFGLVPLLITFVMTFTAIDTASMGLKIFWACISYGLFGAIGATMEYSSTTAQLANMTKNPAERSSAVAIKGALQNVAQIIASVVFISMVRSFGGNAGDEVRGFFLAAIVVAAVLAVICIGWIVVTKKYELNRDGSYREHLIGIGEGVSLIQQLKDLLTLRPVMVVAGNQFIQQSLYAIRSGILIYLFQYYWNLEGFYDQTILIYSVGMVVGSLLLEPAVKLVGDTNRCFILVKIISAALFVINYIMILSMGIEGSGASMQYGAVWFVFILSGVVLGMENVFSFALLPGMVDYSEYKTGMNKGGMVHSMCGLSLTLGSALGGFIFGILLENSGYVANAVQSASTQSMMLLLAFVVPAVLMVVSDVVQCFYGLTDSKLDKIMHEIAKEREEKDKE